LKAYTREATKLHTKTVFLSARWPLMKYLAVIYIEKPDITKMLRIINLKKASAGKLRA
jgi:hypothetical protein